MRARHPTVLAPRWREQGFMQGLGPAFWHGLAGAAVAEVHWSHAATRSPRLGLSEWLHSDQLAGAVGNAAAQAACAAGQRVQRTVRRLGRPVGDGRALLLGEIGSLSARARSSQGSGLTLLAHGARRAVLRSRSRVPVFRGECTTSHPDDARARGGGLAGAGDAWNVETVLLVTRVAPSFLRSATSSTSRTRPADVAARAHVGERGTSGYFRSARCRRAAVGVARDGGAAHGAL